MPSIRRALEDLILRYSDLFKVVVIADPRQGGKTTILKHLIEIGRVSVTEMLGLSNAERAIRLAGWGSSIALKRGAIGGQFFETYAFGEMDKSHSATKKKPSFYFFRINDIKEINLLIERGNTRYPREIKKSSSPGISDLKNFNALNPVASSGTSHDLSILKREVRMGCVVCLSDEAFSINRQAWALPVWAI